MASKSLLALGVAAAIGLGYYNRDSLSGRLSCQTQNQSTYSLHQAEEQSNSPMSVSRCEIIGPTGPEFVGFVVYINSHNVPYTIDVQARFREMKARHRNLEFNPAVMGGIFYGTEIFIPHDILEKTRNGEPTVSLDGIINTDIPLHYVPKGRMPSRETTPTPKHFIPSA